MKLRSMAAAMLACALVTSGAMAAAPDLSKVQCDSPRFEHFIVAQMPHLVSSTDSTAFSQKFSVDSVGSVSTISSAPDELICEVTFNLAHGGISRPTHGQFSLQLVPGGKQKIHWKPGY